MFENHTVAAVLPTGSASAQDALSVATVGKVDADKVVLLDGREFQHQNGKWISMDGQTQIVPASPQHLEVVHRRTMVR